MLKVLIITVTLFYVGFAETDKTDVPLTNSDTPTSVKNEGNWINQGGNKLKTIVKEEAKIIKKIVGLASKGSELSNKMANQMVYSTTGIAQETVKGGLEIGGKSIKAVSDLTKEGINIVDKIGQSLPWIFGKGLRKGAALATKGVNTMESVGNKVIEFTDQVSSGSIQMVNGALQKGNDIANGLVQKTTSKIQNGIDAGSNIFTGGIDATVDILNNGRIIKGSS